MGVHVLRAVVAVLGLFTLLTWAWLPCVRRRVRADHARAAAALPRRPVPEPGELSVPELALLAGGPTRLTQVLLTELYLTGVLRLTRTRLTREHAVALHEEEPRDVAAFDPLRRSLLAVVREREPAPFTPLFRWGLCTSATEALWRSLEERGLRPHDRHLHRAQGRYAVSRLLLVLSMSLGAVVVLYGTFAGMALAREVSAGWPYLVAGTVMVAGSGGLMLWTGRAIGRISPRTADGDRLVRRARERYCRRHEAGGDTVPEALTPETALRRLAVSGALGTHLSAAAHRDLRHTASPPRWPQTDRPERVLPPLLWDFLGNQRAAVANFGPFGSPRLWRRVEVPQGPEFQAPSPDYFDSFFWEAPDHSF